jgi:hypothetical protein
MLRHAVTVVPVEHCQGDLAVVVSVCIKGLHFISIIKVETHADAAHTFVLVCVCHIRLTC